MKFVLLESLVGEWCSISETSPLIAAGDRFCEAKRLSRGRLKNDEDEKRTIYRW
jgi:hypothetical protein